MFEYYEIAIELDLPTVAIDTAQIPWVQYNPRKPVARWGSSLTSLDGGTSGIPDLDSIYEFNRLNNTSYSEKDFIVKTDTYKKYFSLLDDKFDLGRSHVIRFGSGGFFPYHRDFDMHTFRLIYTISNCDAANLVWIVNNQVIHLKNKTWYYINTKMAHSVFSFFGCEFVVFNVINNDRNQNLLQKYMKIK